MLVNDPDSVVSLSVCVWPSVPAVCSISTCRWTGSVQCWARTACSPRAALGGGGGKPVCGAPHQTTLTWHPSRGDRWAWPPRAWKGLAHTDTYTHRHTHMHRHTHTQTHTHTRTHRHTHTQRQTSTYSKHPSTHTTCCIQKYLGLSG